MDSRVPFCKTSAAALATTLLLCTLGILAQRAGADPQSRLTTEQVVHNMVAMNAVRTQALHAYSALRSYSIVYHGLGHESAAMVVQVTFQQPGPKHFTIVSESGSGMLRSHVLEPLLEAERHDAVVTSNDGSAIVPANYSFTLVSSPEENDEHAYVLQATPRRKSKRFLFRGTIWVNPVDFGIERVSGQLPRAPSFWVRNVHFEYRSQKIGDFWLPATNHTHASIRWFGSAELDIRYHDFDLTSTSRPAPPSGDAP